MAVNKIVIQGRLCADPELRSTTGGTSVAGFRVAWSEKYKEREEKLFLDCTAWGKLGEFVKQYFRKGQEIVVEGKLLGRDWTDKEGNKRTTIEMKVDQAHFCGPKQDGAGYAPTQVNKPASGPVNGFEELPDDEGKLPF